MRKYGNPFQNNFSKNWDTRAKLLSFFCVSFCGERKFERIESISFRKSGQLSILVFFKEILRRLNVVHNHLFDFQHLKRSFKPTDLWYENEHRELMLVDANKDSPILAFRRGGAYANRSSTEV